MSGNIPYMLHGAYGVDNIIIHVVQNRSDTSIVMWYIVKIIHVLPGASDA